MSFAATSQSAAGGRRALILTATALAGLAVLFGGAGGASATSLASASTTTSAGVSPASAVVGSPVTLSSTVAASDGSAPTGLVQFVAHFTPAGSSTASLVSLGQTSLTAGASSSTASLTSTSLQAGTYQITAQYNPNGSVAWGASSSSTVSLTVSSVPPVDTSLGLTESTQTISSDQTVTFTTTLSTATGQPAPTGIVRYSAGPDLNHTTTIGQATIVNGTASITKGGWVGGTYVIVAYYDGDSVYGTASAGPLSLAVTQVSVAVSTTTTITLQPATINEGQSVLITAHVVKEGTPNPPPGGAIVSFVGGPYGSDPSSWVKIGSPGQAALDANGHASETVGGWPAGKYTIVAQYSGDVRDGISSGSGTLTVLKVLPETQTVTTSLTYTGATSAAWHDAATLSARLTDSTGAALEGKDVTLTVGSDSCAATTDDSGDAACSVTLNTLPGPATVTALFDGSPTLPGTSASHAFTVTARPTITTASDVTAPAGGDADLSSTLIDQETGAPISGKTVTLTVGPDTCSGATDPTGVATCSVTASEGVGGHQIGAAFAGADGYAGSSGIATLTIQPIATSTTYTGDAHDLVGSTATLSATVAPAPDGGTVTFTLGTQSCTATVASGSASCTVKLDQAPGSGYTVAAAYSGDESFTSSSTSAPFAIFSPTTTTQAGPVSPVPVGVPATLTATVSPSAATGTVTFSTGTTTLCTGTLSAGAASCPTTFGQVGSYAVTAHYDGDGVFPVSSGATTVLVYALAPGGGAFVVGDKSASGSVTFWGAQEWKGNVLSGGAAPAAFKGYALNPSTPKCGVTWSTDPGNSSPPPAGPLPAYMAVIVSSKITKAGSKISGNTVAVVIVKTNAGYDANPGHAGTGTVVTTLCSA
jgi:hypothetical protein